MPDSWLQTVYFICCCCCCCSVVLANNLSTNLIVCRQFFKKKIFMSFFSSFFAIQAQFWSPQPLSRRCWSIVSNSFHGDVIFILFIVNFQLCLTNSRMWSQPDTGERPASVLQFVILLYNFYTLCVNHGTLLLQPLAVSPPRKSVMALCGKERESLFDQSELKTK